MNKTNYIVELSEKDFIYRQPILKNYQDKLVLIKFYTNRCGYCIKTIPDYEELSRQYKNNKRVVIAQMDVEKNKDFIEELNKFKNGPRVDGYPTFHLFSNNFHVGTYNGNRTVIDYINFLNKYY